MKLKKVVKFAIIAVIVTLVLVLFFTHFEFEPEDILRLTPQNRFAAALVVVGIFILKNVLVMIPLTALYVACGMIFGAGWGIAVALIGLACEISIGYYVGKKRGRKRTEAILERRPKAAVFHELLTANPQSACFLSRLIPLPLPVDVVSMYFGANGVPFHTYLTFSLLGLGSKMLPYVIAGKSITNPLSAEFLVPLGIGLAISLGTFLIQWRFQKHGKNHEGQDGKI